MKGCPPKSTLSATLFPSTSLCRAMRRSVRVGLHGSAWVHLQAPEAPPPEGAQVARLARLYMTTQTEPGHLCPLTMTHAAVPALLRQPEIAALLLPKML